MKTVVNACSVFLMWTLLIAFPDSALASEDVTFKSSAWGSRVSDGKTVRGRLFKPDGPGPFPTVVLLPHCKGFKSSNVQQGWPRLLTRNGYAALTVDTFKPQGQSNCVGLNKGESRALQSDYAYGALDYLVTRSDIMKDRIAVMGFSEGAFAINNYIAPGSSLRARTPDFKAAISLYGGCYKTDSHTPADTPLMLIIPEHDSQLAPKCLLTASNSKHIYFHVLDGAYHGFDGPKLTKMKQDDAGNKMLYSRSATEKSHKLAREFLDHFIGPKMGTKLERKVAMKGSEGARSDLDDWMASNQQSLCSDDMDHFADEIMDKVDDLKSEKKIVGNFTISKFKMKKLFKEHCS